MKLLDPIRSVLKEKGHDVWSVSPGVPVYDAISAMADKHVGALLVMDDGKVIGIISERDYARKVILRGKSSRATEVREIMTAAVTFVALQILFATAGVHDGHAHRFRDSYAFDM